MSTVRGAGPVMCAARIRAISRSAGGEVVGRCNGAGRLKRPLGGAAACLPAGDLVQNGGVEQFYLHWRRSEVGALEPGSLGEFLPDFPASAQAHAAQQARRQAGATAGVGAQRALDGEEAGSGGGELRQCGGEVGERLPHPQAFLGPEPVRATCGCRPGGGVRTAELRVGDDGGVAGRGRAGRAGVGQPPGAAAAALGEGEQDRAGAAAVAWMPAAALGPALAGAQVPGQRVGACVAGQMGQGGRPCGGGLACGRAGGALGTDQVGPACPRMQFHRPDAPHRGTAEPHRPTVLLSARAVGAERLR